MDLVSWVFNSSTYDTRKPIFIDASEPENYISSSQARRYVRQMIAGLRANGLRRGDTVCILTLSSIYYPIFFLSIVGAGARVVGGNPGHTVHELEHLLSTCNVNYIITEESMLEKAIAAASTCPISPVRIFMCNGHDASSSDPRCWRTLLQHGETDWDILDQSEAAIIPTAFYSTSGTTGAPKFAAVSHAYQIVSGSYIEKETKAKSYAVSRLVSLPLMHAFAAPLVHCAALRCGTPTYIMPRFGAGEFIDAISRHRITEFPVVPSMLMALSASSSATGPTFASVREVMCAGAPLSTSLAASFSRLLTAPCARLVQLYGATEAGWICSTPWTAGDSSPRGARITSPTFALQAAATPTVGIPCTDYEMRLVHTTTNRPLLGMNIPGLLQVKAPHSFLYYLNAEKATTESFTSDKWLKTGDIAARDRWGRYYIVDREKDMIKVRGWQVAPTEIESVLASHSAVQDCAVVGVEDKHGTSGEVPCAFIALKAGADKPDLAVLQGWLRKRLAGYKVPAAITIVDHIPRNPAGKLLRRVIRDKHLAVSVRAIPQQEHVDSVNTLDSGHNVGIVLSSPTTQFESRHDIPAWPEHGALCSWPATKSGKHCHAGDTRAERWKTAIPFLLLGIIGLGLYLCRLDKLKGMHQ